VGVFSQSLPVSYDAVRIPNGIVTSNQMRVGEKWCNATVMTATRHYHPAEYSLRGVRIEDVPDIFKRFQPVGLTSVQSGMDNVRNITGVQWRGSMQMSCSIRGTGVSGSGHDYQQWEGNQRLAILEIQHCDRGVATTRSCRNQRPSFYSRL